MAHNDWNALVEQSRRRLNRLSPADAKAAVDAGAVLIDIRPDVQRATFGTIPGARAIAFQALERAAGPASPERDPSLNNTKAEVIVICAQGVSSSVAAARLQDIGYEKATDVVGGFEAWRKASLPVEKPAPSFSMRRKPSQDPSGGSA